MVKIQVRGLKRWYYVKITAVCLVCKVRCYVFKEVAKPIKSSTYFLKDRKDLHTTPLIYPGCAGSMKGGKRNCTSKKLPPEYLEEHLWRERMWRDEPTAFINVITHIAGIYFERQR